MTTHKKRKKKEKKMNNRLSVEKLVLSNFNPLSVDYHPQIEKTFALFAKNTTDVTETEFHVFTCLFVYVFV